MTNYYAEWYRNDHRYRSPSFDHLEDLQEYLDISEISNASIYVEE